MRSFGRVLDSDESEESEEDPDDEDDGVNLPSWYNPGYETVDPSKWRYGTTKGETYLKELSDIKARTGIILLSIFLWALVITLLYFELPIERKSS